MCGEVVHISDCVRDACVREATSYQTTHCDPLFQ